MRAASRASAAGDLAGRLRRAGDGSFIGRATERELVAAALAGASAEFAVLYLHGPGGIGKTALLRRLFLDAEAVGALPLLVDGRTLPPSPTGFTAALARQLGLGEQDDPIPVLHAGPRPLLLLDSFEHCNGTRGWLREQFLPRLPETALTVIAAREPPEDGWRLDADWQELLRVVALRNLPPSDASDLLLARGVPEDAHDRVLRFAGGHPLALCLVAEVIGRNPDAAALPEPGSPDVVRTLLERFVDECPSPRHRAALEVCAHARVTTESLLRAALQEPRTEDLFDWLCRRSFVEHGPEGIHPHDLARDVLDAELRWRDPDRYADLHGRLREYVLARIQAPDGDRSRAWRDAMFLHRHSPACGPFLTWEAGNTVYEDRLLPADEESVLRMVRDLEGADSAFLVEYWLGRQPEAFRVYRRPGGATPAGFSVWLRLAEPDPGALAVDPVVALAWEHTDRVRPLRPGEHLGILRTFVVPEAYQRPSPVMDLIQVRAAVEWTGSPGPAVSFLTIADADFWSPQMIYIGHEPAGTVSVGDRSYTLFGHDWRAVPPAAWLRMQAQYEMAGGAAVPPGPDVAPAREVLSAPEFQAAVKEALRCRARRGELAQNRLCRSRLVLEACCGRSPAEALADLLVEATDSLAQDPRDAKLHRAMSATFFRGVPTQEAAAERLGLPFSTYRRHLSAGLDRVTGWLWERELR